MSTLLVLTLAVLILLSVVAVARAVRHDGYGQRPAPRSHPAWDEHLSTPW
ncbi:hypothetical protein [Actinotalea sp. K2]|nr:hypothetical protein [Actinotalea sp. K2]MCL3862647.1 hypothetical protein [Actinotalea sp. K2]